MAPPELDELCFNTLRLNSAATSATSIVWPRCGHS